MRTNENTLTSRDPATGETVWEGLATGPAGVEAAIRQAAEAFPAWSTAPLEERATLLRRFAGVLQEQRERLAAAIAREIGKPLPESRAEVDAMAGKVEISIRAHSERCATVAAGKAVTRFRPHGVVAVLGPYNFPGHLPNGHIVPALLAGNTVVFKPSELASGVAEHTRQCWREAGLPEAVLQVVPGRVETARALAAHPRLDGLFFTGSAATGKQLSRQFAESPGRILALEMGGNNPLIVDTPHLEDLAAAASLSVRSAFLSTGQRCTCARRLVVIESPASSVFLKILVESATALSVGSPFDTPPPFMGPLAHASFPEKVLKAREELRTAGGKVLLEGRAGKPGTGFLSPSIIDVTGIRDVPDEEVFGPLLQVHRVDSLEAALESANRTRFGLAAGLLSDSRERYQFAWPRLRAGIINWNTPLPGASSAAPFGGIGDSGNHRPSAYLAADYCSYPVASMEEPACAGGPS